jgi:hypothetical protein
VADESTTMAINPNILVRACADLVMPAPESKLLTANDFIPVKWPNRYTDKPLN